MHIHEQVLLTNIPNSGPFGKPTMTGIVVEAAFREKESRKLPILKHLQP